jgi:PIN domain nuclease of toxin-antitoxin system
LRLLLDTHAFIWWCEGNKKLGSEAKRTITTADEVFVSAVSAWEIAIKVALGKLVFPMTVERAREKAGFSELSVRIAHADATSTLAVHHADPFDRLLVAQAQLEGLTLVTHDQALAPYRIAILWI